MKTPKNLTRNGVAITFLMLAVLAISQISNAATHYLDFYSTTVAAGNGPVSPTNGVVAISGTNLTAGDVVVFDGVAISQNPGTGDQWAAINLNAGGLHGVTGATLGVKAETANGTGSSQLFPASTSFGDVGATTNHVRIELTVTTTGSTTNMTYVTMTDPNYTKTTYFPINGTVTFPNNTIPLSFGAQAQGQAFYDTSGALGIAATPTSSPPLLAGMSQTFTAIYQGPPSSSFQWLSNNVPIVGATSLTYTTPPITPANNGDLYAVVIYTNSVVAVTSAPSVLNYHSSPVTWVFSFANTNWLNGGAGDITPNVSTITNTYMAPGDTVVFDGIVTGNGPWGGVAINSFGGVPAAGLGALLRFGGNGANGAVYANAINVNNNLTTAAAVTNHLRIELYISNQGSLTNMGWKVLLDQNLTGTYSIIQTGTNLTFNSSSLWLQFESQNCSSISFAQYQYGASVFGYTGGPFTYNGSGQSPAITFSGSTGARTTNYVGVSVMYSSVNPPTNAGNYYVSNMVAADANYLGVIKSQAFTIQQAASATTTVGAGLFTFDGTTHTGGSGTVTGAGGLSTAATSLAYSGNQINAGTYTVTAHYAGDANHTPSDGTPVAITIQQAASATTTVGTRPFTFDGMIHTGGSGTVTGAGGLSTAATSLTYSGNQINAGTYTVTAHYAGDANHTASDGSAVGITIIQATTIAFLNLSSVTNSYGVTNLILTGTVSAAGPVYPANGEVVSATINGFPVSGTVTNSTGDFSINYNDPSLTTNGVAGSPYTITYNYAGNVDLVAATADTSTTLTLTNALLTITANDDSKTYDGTGYSGGNGVSYSGFVKGETSAVLGGTLTYGGTSQGAVGANLYSIVPGGLTSPNYTITFNPGTLAIQQAASATTTAGAGPFTYDGTTHAGGSGTVTGAGGLSTATTSLTYSGNQINAGTYYVTAHYAGDANHMASDGGPVGIMISPLAITVTAQTNTKLYDGNTSAASVPILTSGTIAVGDTVVNNEAYQDANVGTAKTMIPTVTITNLSYGNVTANYSVTPVNDATGVINAVVPTVTSSQLSGGTFQLTFTGPSGQPYEVLASTNVATPLGGWVTNSSGTFPGGNVTYTNQSPADPCHFYRIQSP